MTRKLIDCSGQVFGRLTAHEATRQRGVDGGILWRCTCTCGNEHFVLTGDLRHGHVKSCGCLRRERLGDQSRTHGMAKTVAYQLHRGARRRAEEFGVPFAISISDIHVPTHCPALGIPLIKGGRLHPNSPTLDRILPPKGYVVGNIAVISWRANKLKNNATPEELTALAAWLEKAA